MLSLAPTLRTLCTLFLLLALTVPYVPTASAAESVDWQKISPQLRERMVAGPDSAEWPVIVEGALTSLPREKETGQAQRAQKAAERLQQTGAVGQRVLPIIGSASGRASLSEIAALSRDPSVAFVYFDAPVRALEAAPPVHVYEDEVQAPAVWQMGYTGKGVTVAVLDSGVAPAADLTTPVNRVVARADLVNDGAISLDPGGHGTHVAGIVAGNGQTSGGLFSGVAPNANIVDVRVIDGEGNSSLSTVIHGVQWVLQHRHEYNIRVMNLSLGTPVGAGYTYRHDQLVAALEMAWLAGITVVVPAGNDGPTAGSVTSPGTGPLFIAVGAVDDMGTASIADDSLLSFSGRGPTPDGFNKPDLVAPGRRIISLRSPNSTLDQLLSDRVVATPGGSTYFRLTGTSMSAPIVAGVVALLLEKSPSLSPDQVKGILMHTGSEIKGHDANEAGAGVVDARAALTSHAQPASNRNKRPSDITARALLPLLADSTPAWRNPHFGGRVWANLNWTNALWDSVTWDNVLWDNVLWDNVLWDNVLWDNTLWDNTRWDNTLWDNVAWLESQLD